MVELLVDEIRWSQFHINSSWKLEPFSIVLLPNFWTTQCRSLQIHANQPNPHDRECAEQEIHCAGIGSSFPLSRLQRRSADVVAFGNTDT